MRLQQFHPHFTPCWEKARESYQPGTVNWMSSQWDRAWFLWRQRPCLVKQEHVNKKDLGKDSLLLLQNQELPDDKHDLWCLRLEFYVMVPILYSKYFGFY